ncbi:MAG: flagellar biosynthetic protein FliQ [Planctomycetota bacterium]|jgi:flagellar biosynthetic protein FliQ
MSQQMVIFLARRTLITGLMVVGPLLGAGLLVGLVVAIFQAVTSIREMTLTMIPKILAVVGVLIWLLPWMLSVIVAYTTDMIRWMQVFGG